jgi:hypothetical protein
MGRFIGFLGGVKWVGFDRGCGFDLVFFCLIWIVINLYVVLL